MKRALAVMMLVACNQVFGLSETVALDSGGLDDPDGDGFANASDNCPDLSNKGQSDEDEDGVGDVCDNCPLVPNPKQEATSDVDPVGDACDAHPGRIDDCLIVLDTFAIATDFAAHWTEYSQPSPATITPQNGSVTIAPATPNAVTSLVTRDAAGVLLDGYFDVQLQASTTLTIGSLLAVSNVTPTNDGFSCGSAAFGSIQIAVGAAVNGPGTMFFLPLISEPVGPNALFRLISHVPANKTRGVGCRIEHGFAVGAYTFNTTNIPTGGAPGVRVLHDPAELRAIALYRAQPLPCPPTIFR